MSRAPYPQSPGPHQSQYMQPPKQVMMTMMMMMMMMTGVHLPDPGQAEAGAHEAGETAPGPRQSR